MKQIISVVTILFSTLLSRTIMADTNIDSLRVKTSHIAISKIGNGGATCFANKMTNEEAIQAIDDIRIHLSDISADQKEEMRERIVTLLSEIEN
ncbi:MAG: hypothetical protein KBD76_02250 [Bacteriovorax sp.]|nr:hypothetical protein [Bacteriovorax sp.]